MGPGASTSATVLSLFAERVLLRTRSGTGVAVYRHDDGTWGFLCRATDVAVTRTAAGRVSFSLPCSACAVRVAVCTTSGGHRVTTPCACSASDDLKRYASDIDALLECPETDLDYFASSVQEEVERLGGFGLHGMVRGYLQGFWPTMGRRPDAALWARFFLTSRGEFK